MNIKGLAKTGFSIYTSKPVSLKPKSTLAASSAAVILKSCFSYLKMTKYEIWSVMDLKPYLKVRKKNTGQDVGTHLVSLICINQSLMS